MSLVSKRARFTLRLLAACLLPVMFVLLMGFSLWLWPLFGLALR